MNINHIFYEFIRVSIGTQETLSRFPSESEWNELFDMSEKQSLIGVCFVGVQQLSIDADDDLAQIGISESLYLKWMSIADQIRIRNEEMNKYTKDVLVHFRKAGFACMALKGQGIARLYGPLQEFRQSGDVDVWVSGGRKKLYEHSLKMFGKLEGLTYHHIHYPIYDDLEVEAHVWPSFLSSLLRNRRLHQFFKKYEPKEGCEDMSSMAFNRVYILLHCYQHFTRRGVGMRQLLDYYFVLLQGFSEDEKANSMKWISTLGLKRFAEATMWMMKEVFGLDEQYLLCEPNEKYGRFILDEVMETGNMGHSDVRVDKKQLHTAGGRYLNNLKRDIRIVKICPYEALWEPLWGIYQFVWCKLTNMKYKR